MTSTSFQSTHDGAELSLDLDALFSAIELELPGVDPLPEACARVLQTLGDLRRADTRAIERALMEGLRGGEFPSAVVLEGPFAMQKRKKSGLRSPKMPDHVEGFDVVVHLPNSQSEKRYASLFGLEEHQSELLEVVRELRDPGRFTRWADRWHQGEDLPILARLHRRTPLVVLAGDVGSGKTELAETFGSVLARERDEPTLLLRLGLAARGTGLQGQATLKIQAAFEAARRVAADFPVVLLLDEADALGQSREESQMHHEDRAGVNALIQAVDQLQDLGGQVVVVMCTNRHGALDPALVRRAALVLKFTRPNAAGRGAILRGALGATVDEQTLAAVVAATGESDGRPGFTASDLVTRLVPAAIRRAVQADSPLQAEHLLGVAAEVQPTPPFRGA